MGSEDCVKFSGIFCEFRCHVALDAGYQSFQIGPSVCMPSTSVQVLFLYSSHKNDAAVNAKNYIKIC